MSCQSTLVYALDVANDVTLRTLALLLDFADKGKNSSFATSRTVLHILQTHYPERLGAALIAHVPWLVHTFFKLIMPFIDPVTRSKMIFNPVRDDRGLWRTAGDRDKDETDKPGQPSAKVFDLDQLVHGGWEGSQMFTYEHGLYWPALVEMCLTRRKDMTVVWRRLGGSVGIKEWDVKMGICDREKVDEEKLNHQNGNQ